MRRAAITTVRTPRGYLSGVSRVFLLRAARQSPARRRPWVFFLDVPQGTTAEKTLRAPCDRAPLLALATKVRETPDLRVASPETTALELVGYARVCGGLDNVATVLSELHERLVPAHLRREAEKVPVAWVQRLGYLLELVEAHPEVLAALEAEVRRRARRPGVLDPSSPSTGVQRSRRRRLAVNAVVEPDL